MTEKNDPVGRPFGQKLVHPKNMTDQALEALGYNKPHVWHINGKIIAKFKTGLEAYNAFDNIHDEVNYTIDDVWYVTWKSEVGILLEENPIFQQHIDLGDSMSAPGEYEGIEEYPFDVDAMTPENDPVDIPKINVETLIALGFEEDLATKIMKDPNGDHIVPDMNAACAASQAGLIHRGDPLCKGPRSWLTRDYSLLFIRGYNLEVNK